MKFDTKAVAAKRKKILEFELVGTARDTQTSRRPRRPPTRKLRAG